MGVISAVVPRWAWGADDDPVRSGNVVALPAGRWSVVAVLPERPAEVEASEVRPGNNGLTYLGFVMAAATGGSPAVYMSALVVVSTFGDGQTRAAGDHPGEHEGERRPPAAVPAADELRGAEHDGEAGTNDEDFGGGRHPVERAERFPDTEFSTGRQPGGPGHRPQDQHGDVAGHHGVDRPGRGPGHDEYGAEKLGGGRDGEERSGDGGSVQVAREGSQMQPARDGQEAGGEMGQAPGGLAGLIAETVLG